MLRRLGQPDQQAALIRRMIEAGIAASFAARGASMRPTIVPGDKVIVSKGGTVRTGEVVMTAGHSGLLVHRVVEVMDDGRIVTQGDNRTDRDDPVPAAAVVGVVRRVVRRGRERGVGLTVWARVRRVLDRLVACRLS
jgi:phage repressor protein C with HTH and peptisase S24 domain